MSWNVGSHTSSVSCYYFRLSHAFVRPSHSCTSTLTLSSYPLVSTLCLWQLERAFQRYNPVEYRTAWLGVLRINTEVTVTEKLEFVL